VSAQDEISTTAAKAGRHATTIELFLDLVFVFAVAQIVSVLATDPTAAGFAKGVVLGWLVWWLWSQFAWLGTAIDLERNSPSQLLILAAIPITLLMAIAIPGAYEAAGLKFAGAYLIVNIWCLVIQGQALWADPITRRSWLQYAPVAAIAPLLLLGGAFIDGNARAIAWTIAAIITIASALAGGRKSTRGQAVWRLDPSHFAERHALFVIISLGEVMVAIGVAAAASPEGLTPQIAMGVLAASSLACALWWTYFAFVPSAVERALAEAPVSRRVHTARDLFTFGHFPIIFGVLLYALTAKHVVIDPLHHLGFADLFALSAAIVLFAGALTLLRWRIVHGVAPERIAAIAFVIAFCAIIGNKIPGVLTVTVVAVVVVAMQSITLYRIRTQAGK